MSTYTITIRKYFADKDPEKVSYTEQAECFEDAVMNVDNHPEVWAHDDENFLIEWEIVSIVLSE